jgi:hypothetical protein
MIGSTDAAVAAARAYMDAHFQQPEKFAIFEDSVLVKEYGWVIFYQSRRYMESRNKRDRVAGNAPILVLRDGTVRELATAFPLDWQLDEYEKG